MIEILARVKYQFTGTDEPGPMRYGTVIRRDVPGYPGGKAEGMLHVRWDHNGETVAIHERHVTEV